MALRKEHVTVNARRIRIEAGKTRAEKRTYATSTLKFRLAWTATLPVCRETGISSVAYNLRHTFGHDR
jgi:hypothetical protein